MRRRGGDFAQTGGYCARGGTALPRLHPDSDPKRHVNPKLKGPKTSDSAASAAQRPIVAKFPLRAIEKPSKPFNRNEGRGMTRVEQIKYYRDSAATLRSIAAAVLDPEIRAELLATAAKFETLADWVEKHQDSTDRAGKPQPC
jgi:hypothetical protein